MTGTVGCFFLSKVMPQEIDICAEFEKLSIKDEDVTLHDKADACVWEPLVGVCLPKKVLTIIASYSWLDILTLTDGKMSRISSIMEIALQIIGPNVPTLSLKNCQLTSEDLAKIGLFFPNLWHLNLEGATLDGTLTIREQSKKEKIVSAGTKQCIARKIFPDGKDLVIQGTPGTGSIKV